MLRSHYVNAKSTAQISENFFPTPTHSFYVSTTSVIQINKEKNNKMKTMGKKLG